MAAIPALTATDLRALSDADLAEVVGRRYANFMQLEISASSYIGNNAPAWREARRMWREAVDEQKRRISEDADHDEIGPRIALLMNGERE